VVRRDNLCHRDHGNALTRWATIPLQRYREPRNTAHDIVIHDFEPVQELIFCGNFWNVGFSDSSHPFIGANPRRLDSTNRHYFLLHVQNSHFLK